MHRRSLRHPSFRRTGFAGSHAVEFGDAVALAAALDRLPTRMLLYLVEVADTSAGVGLSSPVAAAVADLVDEIEREVRWHVTAR